MTSANSSETYPHHIPSIPYTSPPTPLQTLDIWLPRPLNASPAEKTLWIIFIHGGAWRDPLQTSSELEPTLNHLFNCCSPSSPVLERIAGFASLNYRLSPYESHSTCPSDPEDGSRNVKHPTHVRDVVLGLNYLGEEYGVGCEKDEEGKGIGKGMGKGKVYEWIGIGHSCGATLLMQLISGIGLPGSDLSLSPPPLNCHKPIAAIGLEGIYDIPLLMRNHEAPKCEPDIEKIYREILEGAFGADEGVWRTASPTAGHYEEEKWTEGRVVVLGHSAEDELVEWGQVEAMEGVLRGQGWAEEGEGNEKERELVVRKLKGGHDFIWEDGVQIKELIEEVVGRVLDGR